jgi:hypothetical protein
VDLDQPKSSTDLAPEPWRAQGCGNDADVLAWLAAEYATFVPATVTTPSGGRHPYFRQPPGDELSNSAGRLGWKIDTRGHVGHVLCSALDQSSEPAATQPSAHCPRNRYPTG